MLKATNRASLTLITILTVFLAGGLITSCATMSAEEIAGDIESGIAASGVEDIEVQVTDEGVRMIAGGLNFPPDSAEIIATTAAELDKLAMVLADYNTKQILIEGHTADIGDVASQLTLSTARAQAVADYLLSKGGLSEGNFTIEGIGGAVPYSADTSKEGLAKNRRVEITILN